MNLKTCLQFDETEETESFTNLDLCLNFGDTLIYAEGNFLSSSSEDEFPIFEFSSSIALIKEINCKNDKFLFIVLEDSKISILDLKTKKVLKEFDNVLPSKIIKIRQSASNIFLLTDSSSLFLIDNFILFTRLTQDLLKERYEAGQILKEFTFDSKVNDFHILENLEFLTVGSDQMISWWKVPDQNEPTATKTSIMDYFFAKPAAEEVKKPPKTALKQLKFLQEPDRTIDKILLVQGNLALLEDSLHGRLLVLDTDLAIILKIFKGYRDCSATLTNDRKLVLWAGNRFALETWEKFPFGETNTVEEFPHCRAKINEDNNNNNNKFNNFYLYDPEKYQLKHFSINQ